MARQKYVCIDLDGTLAHYTEWRGEEHFGEPIDGAREALEHLRNKGWKIIIFTTRANRTLVGAYLQANSLPFDYINFNPEQPVNALGGKVIADAYIDDRAISFNGDWQATLAETLTFIPWEARKEQHGR